MSIITLTLNPAIDKSAKVDGLMPEKKLRCTDPVYEPGGGGINVSRAIKKIGGQSTAYYLSGGPTGEIMKQLLQLEGVTQNSIPTTNWTRENFIAYDIRTEQQYRFGMPGPHIEESEYQKCLDIIRNMDKNPEYLVASGSLPPGIPVDFYKELAEVAKEKNIKLIVDTSGEALKKTVESGVYMIKPNLKELANLAGTETIDDQQIIDAGNKLLSENKCSIILVSMGAKGGLMMTKNGHKQVVPPVVRTKSTVGAGDSMTAGAVFALSQGKSLFYALQFSIAAGTAATMNPGTALCKKEDIDWIMERMNDH